MNTATSLKLFISSNGIWVPRDVALYTLAGDKDNLCVLCDNPHNYHAAIRFNKTNMHGFVPSYQAGQERAEEAYFCSSCVKNVNLAIGEQISEHPKTKQRTKENNPHIDADIQKYVEEGIVRSDADSYTYGRKFGARCLFCEDNLLSQFGKVTPIELPVGKYLTILGRAHACGSCSDLLSKYVSEGLNKINHPDECIWDLCKSCNAYHLVTPEEYRARKKDHTLTEHWCSGCLEHERYDLINKDRFISRICHSESGCTTILKFDLTRIREIPPNPCCLQCYEKSIEETPVPSGSELFGPDEANFLEEKHLIQEIISMNGLVANVYMYLREYNFDLPYCEVHYTYMIVYEDHQRKETILYTSGEYNDHFEACLDGAAKGVELIRTHNYDK